MDKSMIKLSKTMSWLLRHHVSDKGLNMDDEGYILLDDMLSLDEFNGVNYDQVRYVVDNNEKKRFSMVEKDTRWYIRANQGHSKATGDLIDDTKALTPVDTSRVTVAYHGTNNKAWKGIKVAGLRSMGRKHVHMASAPDVVAGLRKNSPVVLEIDLAAAAEHGVEFMESENGVILTKDLIHPMFIRRI